MRMTEADRARKASAERSPLLLHLFHLCDERLKFTEA